MKQLIVNADDFGLTSGVNQAVIEGHERGIITSATVMANMPAFDEAVRLAQAHPSLGVGLHFNLTQGKPVADISHVRSLTEGSEFLPSSMAVAWRSFTGRLRTEELVIELRAQLEKAIAAGLRLTHADGHQHVQTWPQVFEALARALPDYGIRAVRLPRERPHLNGAKTSPKVIKQSLVAFGLAQLSRANFAELENVGLRTTDAFFGIAHTGCWTKSWLVDVIEHLPEGVSELMCHPGYEDRHLARARTRLRASRAMELELLTDPDIAALLQGRAVSLINYGQITAGLASSLDVPAG